MSLENRLYPRLLPAAAEAEWASLEHRSLAEIGAQLAESHDGAVFAATGGPRVTAEELKALRTAVMRCATELGFPEQASMDIRGKFDADCGRCLYETMAINPGEAGRDEVWSFITMVLLPDVARWRFPKSGPRRFLGGVRNTFQRLWWRAHVLLDPPHANPFHLLAELPEDAMVGIMERPGVSSNRQLACVIGCEAVAAAAKVPSSAREDLCRDALKRIRQRVPVLNLDALPEAASRQAIAEIFQQAAEASAGS